MLSAEDVLGKATELGTLVDRLKREPDAWRDDDHAHAAWSSSPRSCGDIRENALVPDQVIFRHNAFWTSHFGGTYVFVDPDTTTVICDPAAPGFRRSRPWQVSYIADQRRRPACSRFLADSGRIELPRASWLETSGYLEHRAEMAIRALIRENDPDRDMGKADKVWLQTWIHGHADLINKDGTFPFLNADQARGRPARPPQDRRGVPAAALPDRARQARPSGCLADQPADLGIRAVGLRARNMSSTSRASTRTTKAIRNAWQSACCGRSENHISEGQGGVQRAPLRPHRLTAAAGAGKARNASREGGKRMLDPIVNFFTRIFQWIGRGIGLVIGVILWPFMWAGRWYVQRGWILKAVARRRACRAGRPLCLFLLATQVWTQLQPELSSTPTSSRARNVSAGEQVAPGSRHRHCQDLRAFRHRRRRRRPDRLQRQPERLDLVDDPLQARPVRHSTGTTRRSSTTRPRSSAASTRRCAAPRRNSPTISAACAAPRRSTPTCRMRAATSSSTKRPGISACNPFGPKTPTPSYYRDRRSRSARLQRPAAGLPGGVRRPRRQSEAVSRPRRQRHRLDLGDPQGARRELQ